MSIVDYISNLDRPSYAPSFDGIYFEDEIPGYRTNEVSGRDSLQLSLSEVTNDLHDGSLFLRNRLSSRDITVKFAIVTDTQHEYRRSANLLKMLCTKYNYEPLQQTEFQIIFSDESDVFYKGAIASVTLDKMVDERSGTGQFTIHCADPCKYSVEEFTVSPGQYGEMVIDYDGTYMSYPKLTARIHSTTSSYVGFVNDQGRLLQIGSPDEIEITEEEPRTKSQVIFTDDFANDPNLSDSQSAGYWTNNWQVNPSGFEDPTDNIMRVSDKFSATGTADVSDYISGKNLHATGYGSDNFGGWHGPVITRIHNFADSNNVSKHLNGTLEVHGKLVSGTNDYGECIITLDHHITEVDPDTQQPVLKRVAIAKLVFFKKTKGTNRATCSLMIYSSKSKGGRLMEYFTFDCGPNGNVTKARNVNNAGPATYKLTKIGDKVIFNVNGQEYTYRDSAITDITIDSVSFAIAKHKNVVHISENYITYAQFTSHSVSDYRDVPNKLYENDLITVDTSSGLITRNNLISYDLGSIGNDWEYFFLHPGKNEVVCTWSDDNDITPDFTLSYRKVYL